MFDRTIESDPRPAAPHSRATYRMRDGHRREYAASRDRGSVSFHDRSEAGARRRGHLPLRLAPGPRRDPLRRTSLHPPGGPVNAWIHEGLAQEIRTTGPKGRPFKGPDPHAERRGCRHASWPPTGGLDRGQEIRFARTRRSEVRARHRHLSGLSAGAPTPARAGRRHPARAPRRRAQEHRRTPERVRARERRPTGSGRRTAPRRPGSSVSPSTRGDACYIPMRRSNTPKSDGRSGRVNIEVASGNYRAPSIRAKAAAGFVLHANGPAAARLLRSLGVGDGGDRSSLRGPADRDPAALEL